tara:strand:+ start:203 stop:691 length:489 start_codon:yes stop_codon:yes gene_type:complete
MILNYLNKFYFLILLIFSSLIISGAYILEYFYNFPPCKLCIYQRIPYFLIIIVCFFSFFAKYKSIHFYIAFFLLFSSFLIASFHSLVERGLVEFNSGCSSSANSFENIDDLRNHLDSVPITKCDEILFSIMGFSLANINAIISFFLVLLNIYFVRRFYGSKN